MVKVPVFHEVVTSGKSVGALVTGDVDKAKGVWKEYAKESVIGSTGKAGAYACKGEHHRAKKAIKGAGRATGHALVGGGILPESVPIFKEVNKAGKAFGDVITGDRKQAKKRFTEELKNEYKDPKFLQTMTLDLAATTASVAIAVSTAGLGTPVALVAAHATGSAATSVAVNAADQGIDIMAKRREGFDKKQLLSTMVESSIVGGFSTTASLKSNGAIPDATIPFVAKKNEKRVNKEENQRYVCLCIPDCEPQFRETSNNNEDNSRIRTNEKTKNQEKIIAEKGVETDTYIDSEICNKNDMLKNKTKSWKRNIKRVVKRKEGKQENNKQKIDKLHTVSVF